MKSNFLSRSLCELSQFDTHCVKVVKSAAFGISGTLDSLAGSGCSKLLGKSWVKKMQGRKRTLTQFRRGL